MRMKYVVANWKMAPATRKDAEKLFAALQRMLRDVPDGARIVLCPPHVWLPFAPPASEKVALGAQDLFWEPRGAHTGEISSSMLASLGVSFVLVGHSERRAMGEDNAIVQKKLKAVLDAGMTAILCVGERDRASDHWHDFLGEQIESAFSVVERGATGRLIVAYEPVWAIGGSTPDTPDDALTVALLVRKIARKVWGESAGENLPVLYGGSVEAASVGPFATQEGIDGVLVGHASLDTDAFSKIAGIISGDAA